MKLRDLQKTDIVFFLALLVIFSIGIYYRLSGISVRGLEYDEIWTINNYVSKGNIWANFTNLTIPNNHPLNSFIMGIIYRTVSGAVFWMRFPALVTGILLMLAAPFVPYLLFRSRMAVILTLAFTAFNGALIHFSQTARGYSLQIFFITCFLAIAIILVRNIIVSRYKRLIVNLLLMFTGYCAVFCLPTTVLYILPIAGLHVLWCIFAPDKYTPGSSDENLRKILHDQNSEIIISYIILGIGTFTWYYLIYDQFKASKITGEVVVLWMIPGVFIRILSFMTAILVPILGAGLLIKRKTFLHGIAYIVILLFPFCCVPFVNVGPDRIYTPLLPVIFIAAAGGIINCLGLIETERSRNIFAPLLVAGFVCFSFINLQPSLERWTPTDWKSLTKKLIRKFPERVYLSFPSSETYPIRYNNYPDVVIDTFNRTPKDETYFVLVGSRDRISGMSMKSKGEKIIPVFGNQTLLDYTDNCVCAIYRLKKIKPNSHIASNVIIAVIPPLDKLRVQALVRYLQGRFYSDWLLLNCWLQGYFTIPGSSVPMDARVLAIFGGNELVPELLKIQEMGKGMVQFYYLKSIKQQKQQMTK